jgi:hypothetical protein
MEKQTAVEWLVANIDWMVVRNSKMQYKMIIEQAKEMEKEQRKEAYRNGYANDQKDAFTQ